MNNLNKNKLLLIAVSSATLVGCVSLSKPFSNSDNTYKILDTPKNVIETDINNRIINSAENIQNQLNLLVSNNYNVGINNNGVEKMPQNQDLREITMQDQESMMKNGGISNYTETISPVSNLETLGKTNRLMEQYNKEKNDGYSLRVSPEVQDEELIKMYRNNYGYIKTTQADGTYTIEKISAEQNTLEKQVKLKGVYSVNDLLGNIANLIGYELVLVNPEKDLSMNISNKNDEYFQGTALLTLKNIGNGLGERGKLTVNIDKKIIKLEIR